MKTFLLPTILVAATAMAPMAFAATKTEGTVRSYDAKTMMLTLEDGTTYKMPKGYKAAAPKAGEKVAIDWTMTKKVHQASDVKMMK